MINTKKLSLAAALLLVLSSASGCSDNGADMAQETATTTPVATSQETATPHTMQVGSPMSASALTGTVVETFDSGGYTYVQLDNGQDKIWVAMGQTTMEQGQQVSLASGPVMKDFHSPSLNRTFSEIVFSSGPKGGATSKPHGTMTTAASGDSAGSAEDTFMAALSSGSPAPAMGGGASSGGSTKAIVSAQELQVTKAEGDNGRTVAEVFAQAEQLNGQTVKVRGKVVKFSPQIMGTNWIHIQDGTGNPMHNSHDLVVTTDATVAEGAIVLVEGTLAAKKDFGMGYFYEALVEKAAISK